MALFSPHYFQAEALFIDYESSYVKVIAQKSPKELQIGRHVDAEIFSASDNFDLWFGLWSLEN